MKSNLDETTVRQLSILAKKLELNSAYMAWVLRQFQLQEKVSENKMLELLNTNKESLVKLALARRPEPEIENYSEFIDQISKYTNIDSFTIVKIIRRVESLVSFQSNPNLQSSVLGSKQNLGFAAAKDKESDDPPSESTKE